MPIPLFIHGMKGLGDNLFQRPFVRAACARHPTVFLETPWPELYEDLPKVRPVRSLTKLRTQRRNERASRAAWVTAPGLAKRARFSYGSGELRHMSILEALDNCVPLGPGDGLYLDLPAGFTRPAPILPAVTVPPGAPYVVVRPATVRREWSNPWRNPRPEYLADAARACRRAGYRVVVVADLEDGEEWLDGELPPYDMASLDGSLDVRELFGLLEGAAGVIGGVGWIVPAALAMQKPTLVVLGGNGMHNAPEKITDPRLDLSPLTFARPDRFCMCEGKVGRRDHECDKRIRDLSTPIERWLTKLPPLPLRSIERRSA